MNEFNELYKPTANEPTFHPLVRNSFAFVPSAGMRLAPEILILELFREVFFPFHYGDPARITKDLAPDELDEEGSPRYSEGERAVLYALKGRRKKTKNSLTQPFFAPAYPALARGAWFSKNRERVIRNFLLSGPIAQHLWHRGSGVEEKQRERDDLIDLLLGALVGNKSCSDQNMAGKEILSVALRSTGYQVNSVEARRKLESASMPDDLDDKIIRIDQDELATRIFRDLRFICQLENDLPRLQWMQVLMTFLRFSLPMWLLAQMQITSLLHSWLIMAADNGQILDSPEIVRKIAARNIGLLHPTLMPTREVFEKIEQYMKHRVEVNIFLRCLEKVRPSHVENKKLRIYEAGSNTLSIEGLLVISRDASLDLRALGRFREVADGLDIRRFLTREGELFPGWRDPLLKGQGKNIDEFLRVLYRAALGDEAGGYLLIPEGRGASRGFRVFPGQLLLKTVTYLAAQDLRTFRGGKLVLSDIENHFQQYGIDFSIAADARPLFMQELQAIGLLTGSPDAGSSVAVACPYPINYQG